MIVRSKSMNGNVLYQGTLEQGQSQRFDGQGALAAARVAAATCSCAGTATR